MHSSLLAKVAQERPAKPALLATSWLPPVEATAPSAGNLEEALRALAEAEHVIHAQARQISRLENLAMTDELTGLLNRRGFLMAFHRELALARRDASVNGILVMADLDGFKSINDRWGHGFGDDYLQAAAHTLLGSVRSSDLVARLGGDEFALLLPRMDEATGLARLARLERNINSCILQCGGKALPLRASCGMAVYTGMDTPETILARADLKLYAHKASRRASRA